MHKQPVVVVSIPKAGTHLLTEMLNALGYCFGGKLTSKPKPDHWYTIEQQNSHTPAHFITTIEPYHVITTMPILFIYRHPLDILISEAHYQANPATTAFSSSLSELNLAERISLLQKGSYLNSELRVRICNYLGWLELGNVIPISFEELVGERGGGDRQLQLLLIESIQRRLGLPIAAEPIADRVFSESSPTFRSGKINNYRRVLQAEHYEILANMPCDFITTLGYQIDGSSDYSSRIGEFRDRNLVLRTENLEEIPILIQNDFFQHNIVYFRHKYYAAPQICGEIRFNELEDKELSAFISAEEIDECKFRIAFTQMSTTNSLPDHDMAYLVEAEYLATNIVYFQHRYYAVPQQLGNIDFSNVSASFLNNLVNTEDLQSIKALISYQSARDYFEQHQSFNDNEIATPEKPQN